MKLTLTSLLTINPEMLTGLELTPAPDSMGIDLQLLSDVLEDLYGNMGLIAYSVEELQRKFKRWWSINAIAWQKLYQTTKYDYDPIANFDRKETSEDFHTVTESGEDTRERKNNSEHSDTMNSNSSGGRSGTRKNSDTENTTTTGETDSTEEKLSAAYNSETYKANEKTVGNSGSNGSVDRLTNGDEEFTEEDSGTVEQQSGGESTESGEESGTFKKTVEEKTVHTATLRGNIGVTTTQQMIEAERKIVQFNLYDHIATAFKERFCIMIY